MAILKGESCTKHVSIRWRHQEAQVWQTEVLWWAASGMRAVRKCCICCYPRLWSKKVDDGFASEATVPWNDNILRVLDWGLGSNRAERFDFSLWKFPKVFLSSLVPDGARWCQMCIWGVWPRPRRSRWARPGGSNSFVGDPEPDLQVGTRNPWDIWKWWDTFNILHKILHNIILYKALNNIKLNRRSLVWTTTIVNHLNIADEPWARKNRATSAPKDPKGKNEVATYYSLDSYDSYIYNIPMMSWVSRPFVVSCQVRSGPSRDCGAGRLHGPWLSPATLGRWREELEARFGVSTASSSS